MLKWFVVAFLAVAGTAPGQEAMVEVVNPAPFDRPLETVELRWRDLPPAIQALPPDQVGIFRGEERLVDQKIDHDGDGSPDVMLFQSEFRSGEKREFVVKRIQSKVTRPSVADAKYILPRKDIAWENDRIAFRIYGGPLAGDVRNGLDVWVKRVTYPIIDKWYRGDSLKKPERISYHVDHGEGADFFNVGRSLGAGACALWKDGTLYQPGFFKSYRIIATGPIRTIFAVTYEGDSAGGMSFSEELTCTLDAGENLNRIDVKYSGVSGGGGTKVAAGLVKRAGTAVSQDEKSGWISLWGLTNDDTSNGYLGTGVIMTGPATIMETSDHALILRPLAEGERLTYYAGAGWSRGGEFASVESWNGYLTRFSERIAHPLRVSVSSRP